MLHLPKAIAWGRDNESRACLKYVSFMKGNGHPDLETSPAGFVVHPSKCWLGATSDAWVLILLQILHTALQNLNAHLQSALSHQGKPAKIQTFIVPW